MNPHKLILFGYRRHADGTYRKATSFRGKHGKESVKILIRSSDGTLLRAVKPAYKTAKQKAEAMSHTDEVDRMINVAKAQLNRLSARVNKDIGEHSLSMRKAKSQMNKVVELLDELETHMEN